MLHRGHEIHVPRVPRGRVESPIFSGGHPPGDSVESGPGEGTKGVGDGMGEKKKERLTHLNGLLVATTDKHVIE